MKKKYKIDTNLQQPEDQSCTSLLCKTRSTICSLLTTYYSAWHACLPCFFCSSFFFFACSLFHVTIYDLQHQHNHSSNQACFITVILPSILRYLCFAFYIQLLYIYKYNLKEYEHFLTTKTRITTVCGRRSGQCVRAFARALCSETSQRSKNVLFSLLHRLIQKCNHSTSSRSKSAIYFSAFRFRLSIVQFRLSGA